MQLQPGQILADKYRIIRQIGQGGMGAVFEGENIRIHRKVAIKTLHAAVAGKADILQRFEREAQAAGRIGSEHIVEVLDMGDLPDGSRFMVMEFLSGKTLGDRIIVNGKMPARELAVPLMQLLDGLGRAHVAGIIHRDLKPANVFLLNNKPGQPDFVKILDFGVSKFNVLNAEEMSMTRTGAVMGTPYYMSPEQAKGARTIDTRSDLYSVGVIIYEAVTGQVPFNAETFNELIFKIALEAPPPAESFVPNLDPAFAGIMRKAMAREPNERFQTAEEMRAVLAAWVAEYDAQAQAAAGGPAILHGTVAMGPPAQATTAQFVASQANANPPGQQVRAGGTVVMEASSQAGEGAQTLVYQAGGQAGGPYQAGAPAQTTLRRQVPSRKGSSIAIIGGVAALAISFGGYFAYAQLSQPSPPPSTPSLSASAVTKETALPAARPMPPPGPAAEPTASAPQPEPTSSTPAPSQQPTSVPPAVPTAVRPGPKPPTTATSTPKIPKPARTITPELF